MVKKTNEELINELTAKMNDKIKKYKSDPKEELKLLDFMNRFNKYSARNIALLNSQYKGAYGVSSYKEHKANGYQVNKGQKALRIFAPKIVKTFLSENGERKYYNQATNIEKEKIKLGKIILNPRTTGFVAVPVFDITQTDCPPEDYPKLYPNKPENFEYNGTDKELAQLKRAIESYAKGKHIDVSYDNIDRSSKGYYVPSKHKIVVKKSLPETDKTSVLLHELAHSIMHNPKMMKNKSFNYKQTNVLEYQAEMTAYLLGQTFGLNTEEVSSRYIANWTNRDVEDEIYLESLDEVKSVAKELTEGITNIYNSLNQKRDLEIEDYYKDESEFSDAQIHQISTGYMDGLTDNQVSMYAKPEFDDDQMLEIKKGFINGLSNEQVGIYATPEFDWAQMHEIRTGYMDGLTDDQVSVYANPEFDYEQMTEIRSGSVNGLSNDQISMYANPEFAWEQMFEIRSGYENGLSNEQVNVYATPEFDDEQMKQIRRGFISGLSDDQVSIYTTPEFDDLQMFEIQNGFINGLSNDQVSVYANPEFDHYQMLEIKNGFINGLSNDQVSVYANPEINSEIMSELKSDIECELKWRQDEIEM